MLSLKHLFRSTRCTADISKRQFSFFTKAPLIRLLWCLFLLGPLLDNPISAQNTEPALPTQTIRGTVQDAISKAPLIGVNVLLDGSEPLIGTITDLDGHFELTNIPIGRVTLNLMYLGYETRQISNVVIKAGKETVLEIEMTEGTTDLEEIVVTANRGRARPNNEMALLSARSISTEEMNRFTASFNDPALITANYAGVTNTGDGANDIIIRGNSPKYMQWRLEGVPISNPNHFADQNNAIGATSALNTNLLASSDFYMGAFPAEYGNTLSGVYDIRLRNGNNEAFEGIVGVGLIGTDLTLEGPLKQGYGGSYLVNYRYSTSGFLNQLGLLDVKGEPKFQDATIKLHLPTKKWGIFSLYSLGGHSTFTFDNATREDWDTPGDQGMSGMIFEDFDKTSYLLNSGLNHSITLGQKSYLKTSLAYSLEGLDDDVWQKPDSLAAGVPSFVSETRRSTYRASTSYQRKINSRISLQAGAIYTSFGQRANQLRRSNVEAPLQAALDFDERIGNFRSFVSGKFRIGDRWTVIAGLHNTNVFFNDQHTLEPRLAARWQTGKRGALNFGYGSHSNMESVHHYFAEIEQTNGSTQQTNLDLGLLKAHHLELGYSHYLRPNLLAKVEMYYQYLYDLPVENRSGSYFSTINEGAEIEYYDLVNEGLGENYGIELSLQRFFDNDLYFLINASFYESNYQNLDGTVRNTRFAGEYLFNAIVGKEYPKLGAKQNKTLGLNARFFLGGGQKIIPLLRDADGQLAVNPQAGQYWDYDRAYEDGLDELYQLSLSVSYKIERPTTTHELFLNLDNLTDRKGRLTEYYDQNTQGNINYTTQFGMLPNLMYRLYF